MTIDKIISNLKNKPFHSSPKKLTGVEQFNLEKEWTNYLLNLVGLGNTHILKNFRYWLVMEDTDEEKGQLK